MPSETQLRPRIRKVGFVVDQSITALPARESGTLFAQPCQPQTRSGPAEISARNSLRREHCGRAPLLSRCIVVSFNLSYPKQLVSPHLTPSNWPPSTCLTSSPSTCLAPTSFGAPSVPLPLVPLASAFAFPSILVFSCGPSPFFPGPFWSSRSSRLAFRLCVTSLCHFLVVLASALHSLLALRHLLRGPAFIASS